MSTPDQSALTSEHPTAPSEQEIAALKLDLGNARAEAPTGCEHVFAGGSDSQPWDEICTKCKVHKVLWMASKTEAAEKELRVLRVRLEKTERWWKTNFEATKALRSNLATALGVAGSPDDEALVEHVRGELARMEGESAEWGKSVKELRQQLAAKEADRADVLALIGRTATPDGSLGAIVATYLQDRPTEADLATLRARLAEARAAEAKERERAEKAERELARLSAQVDEKVEESRSDADAISEERSEWERERTALCGRAEAAEGIARKAQAEATAAEAGMARAEHDLRNRERELADAVRRAAVAEEERVLALERLRQRDAELVAVRERRPIADSGNTEAQALRRRVVELESELRGEQSAHRRQAGITMMVLDLLFDKTMCCGQLAEHARNLRAPGAKLPPEELQCRGSGGPLGELDDEGRFRRKHSDFSASAGPAPLTVMPEHPPLRGGGR